MSNDWNDLRNMNVWKSETAFNSSAWENLKTKIKLLSVPWDSSYEHVVNWSDDSSRNDWFNNISGTEIETNWNFKTLPGTNNNTGTVNVKIPYESVINCNYIYVNMYEQPTPDAMDEIRTNFFFFIVDAEKIAGNTTRLTIDLDVWVTYKNSIVFSNLQLERGHWPHVSTSVDDYLNDPLNNNLYVNAVEPDLPSIKPKVSHTEFISLQSSEPRVCIAMTADLENTESFWFSKSTWGTLPEIPSENWWAKEPTITTPLPTPDGYQGPPYERYDNGVDDSGFYPKSSASESKASASEMLNQLNVYSISPNGYASFINDIRSRAPQLLKNFKAIYLLSEDLINESSEFTFYGTHKLKKVTSNNNAELIKSLDLTKEMFGYNEDSKDFVKLYTEQFAVIEITDLNGVKVELNVEEVNESLDFYARASTSFPFLKLEMFINGIGGKNKKSFSVKPFNTKNSELFDSRWQDFKFEIDIPVYSVFADVIEDNYSDFNRKYYDNHYIERKRYEREHYYNYQVDRDARANHERLHNYNEDKNESDYEIAMDKLTNSINIDNRNKDLSYDFSVLDSEKVDYTYIVNDLMIGNSLTASISKIEESNNLLESLNISNKQVINNNFNSDNLYDITIRDLDHDLNVLAKDLIDMELFTEENIFENSMKVSEDSMRYNLAVNYKLLEADVISSQNQAVIASVSNPLNGLSAYANLHNQSENQAKVFNQTNYNAVYQWQVMNQESYERIRIPVVYNDDDHATNPDRPWTGPATGVGSAYYNYYQNRILKLNSSIENYNSGLTNINSRYNALYLKKITDRNDNIWKEDMDYGANKYFNEQNIEIIQEESDSNRSWASSLNDYVVTEILTKANLTKDNTELNINDKYALESDINWVNYYNAATRTSIDNVNKNVDFQREMYRNSILNEDQHLDNYTKLEGELYSNFIGPSNEYGTSAGDSSRDSWGERGLQVQVRRCSDSIAEQASKLFSRYGYNVNNAWVENPVLDLMTDFTYWKALEVWVTGDNINESNKNSLKNILLNGVTVWDSPEKVFSTDIINNKVK